MEAFSENIKPEAVKNQLAKIFLSEKFLSSERFRSFLSYIVDLKLSGDKEKIKELNIGIEVFDRGKNYDPQTDPIVRIYAGRLRQALKDYYLTEGKNDEIRVKIPKGTYIPEFTSLIGKSKEISASKISTDKILNRKNKYLKVFFLGIAFVGLISFIFFKRNQFRTEIVAAEDEYGRTSIQISGFENLNNDPENEQFILRLINHTEIALGQFSITLINSESSKIDSQSHSNYSMSGFVIQENDQIRVTIKLVDNQTNIQVFTKEYIEDLNKSATNYIEQIFANKIAIDLADEFGELQKFKLRSAKFGNSELLPHEAVLLYFDYLTHMSANDNEKVIYELENTLKNFGEYAPAWAALSGAYIDKYKIFEGNPDDILKAQNAIKKAEIINPRSWQVQHQIAQIALLEGNHEKFYLAIEKQMKLNPNSTMIGQIGLWLCLIGDLERGIPLIEESKLKNPYYPRFFHFGNALFYIDKGDFENAYKESRKIGMPDLFWDPLFRAAILGKLGRIEEAKLALNELLELRPNFPTNGPESMALALYSEKYRSILLEGLQSAGLVLQ